MDLVTHALISFAIVRAFFPRADKVVVAGAILAGCLADIDWLSTYLGAPSFFAWHFTYLHSLVAALFLFTSVSGAPVARMYWQSRQNFVPQQTNRQDLPSNSKSLGRTPFAQAFAAFVIAASLHVALDACQSDGVMLLWPFSHKRYALDWLPSLDPWILAILILAIALPELLHLVGSEIGAKSKKPRGRTGALLGLALILVYIAARATFHSQAVAALDSRTFHGESAHHVSAFPQSLSPFVWHAIAETERSLNQADINVLSIATFDADATLQLFKPETSPTLEAARNTRIAREFLAAAQVPRANVEKTDVGYVVILRDMRFAATGDSQHEIAALIELDPTNKIVSQEIVWARDLHN